MATDQSTSRRTHVKKPPAPPEVEIIDSSLMAICRALATPADVVRSLGRRRKFGTFVAELRAARSCTLALLPAKPADPGRNAPAGASDVAHNAAAAKAAKKPRILFGASLSH